MKVPNYETSNSSYGYYHDFWRRSSLLQLPSQVKNREIDRLRWSTRTSSEVYGAFYHTDFDRWANPNVAPSQNIPGQNDPRSTYYKEKIKTADHELEDRDIKDAESSDRERVILPPLSSARQSNVGQQGSQSPPQVLRTKTPRAYDSIRLPDIKEVELNFTLGDTSRVTLHAVPKIPKSIYQSSYK